MVEILEEGKLNYYKAKCCKCNSTLKFTRMDEEEEYGISVNFFIKCPKCNQKILTRAYSEFGWFIYRETVEQTIDSQSLDS